MKSIFIFNETSKKLSQYSIAESSFLLHLGFDPAYPEENPGNFNFSESILIQ